MAVMNDAEKARRLLELQRMTVREPAPSLIPAAEGAVDAEPDGPSFAGVPVTTPTPSASDRLKDARDIQQFESAPAQVRSSAERDQQASFEGRMRMARRGSKMAARQNAETQRVADIDARHEYSRRNPVDTWHDVRAPVLAPADMAAMRKKYENSGHTQTTSFDDWYQENFYGESPETAQKSAHARPTVQAGTDPMLQPGTNSGLAQSRQAAGKPLPEGRDASQYSEDQRRKMGRNLHSPEVPMSTFGGTFTQNVDGSVSSRAPDQTALDEAKIIAEQHGENSASHIMAQALAYGIDATQYGDDMDLLKADVMREKQRHATMAGKYDVEQGPMGGYVYVPNQKTRDAMQARRTDQLADQVVERHEGLMTPEERASIETYATTPDGFAQLRELNNRLNRRSLGLRSKNVRNNWRNINTTIAMNNPTKAQGLYMASLQEAARTGDPMQVAAVHESFGNDRAARSHLVLAGQQAEAAAVAAAGEAAARAKAGDAPTDKPYADRFGDEVAAAMRNPDPVVQRTALIGILTKMEVVPPDQVEKVADALIMSASGGAVTPEQTRTWWGWLTGSGSPQTQPSPQQPQPLPAGVQGPAMPPTPAAPASGRGASLDAAMDFLRGNRPQLQPNHPYSRRGS